MKKWEYMVQRLPHDQPDIEKGLDKLGKEGWEMTGCGTTGTGFDTNQILLLFFKREIPEQPMPTTGVPVEGHSNIPKTPHPDPWRF